MWLFNSSVGRKVVMSVTGIALVLFLTFHACMNVVVLFSPDAYNTICELLGANWYAVVATLALAALVVCHFVYAFILTLQNKKARGANRYAVTAKPEKVEWASQNMFVLGVIVVLGLLLHLFNFWYNMMFAELVAGEGAVVELGGRFISPTDGTAFIIYTFSHWYYVLLYLVWLCALWFHLTHGIWSGMQTLGVSGKTWFNRWKCISNIYATLLILCFAVVVIFFYCLGTVCA